MIMTKEQAIDFFANFYHGEHHFPNELKPFGEGWCINNLGDLATFDFNSLTRLVLMAHDYCFRVSVGPSGPGMVKIAIHKRNPNGKNIYERHPSIEDVLKEWRVDHSDFRNYKPIKE